MESKTQEDLDREMAERFGEIPPEQWDTFPEPTPEELERWGGPEKTAEEGEDGPAADAARAREEVQPLSRDDSVVAARPQPQDREDRPRGPGGAPRPGLRAVRPPTPQDIVSGLIVDVEFIRHEYRDYVEGLEPERPDETKPQGVLTEWCSPREMAGLFNEWRHAAGRGAWFDDERRIDIDLTPEFVTALKPLTDIGGQPVVRMIDALNATGLFGTWTPHLDNLDSLLRSKGYHAEFEKYGLYSPQPDLYDRLGALKHPRKVETRRIDWLWKDWIAFDTITVLDGDSTVGKSLMMLDLIARMSRGGPMPDGAVPEAAAVIIVNYEDNWERVLVPRLEAAGADLDNGIRLFKGKPSEAGNDYTSVILPDDLVELRKTIEAVKMVTRRDHVLVYVDPLMSVLSDETNLHNYHETLRALEPIHRLCGETGAAFIGIRHLTKANMTGKAIHLGQGSVGIFSTAREGLLVAYDPDDTTEQNARRRILAISGSNIGPKRKSLTFTITTRPTRLGDGTTQGVPVIAWGEKSDLSADDLAELTSGDRGPGAKVQAIIKRELKDGPQRHTTVFDAVIADSGASDRTFWRVMTREVDAGRVLKAKYDGSTWYALRGQETELDVLAREG